MWKLVAVMPVLWLEACCLVYKVCAVAVSSLCVCRCCLCSAFGNLLACSVWLQLALPALVAVLVAFTFQSILLHLVFFTADYHLQLFQTVFSHVLPVLLLWVICVMLLVNGLNKMQ